MKQLKLDKLIANNSNVIKNKLNEVIKPTFSGLENPSKYKYVLDDIFQYGGRKPLLRQARLVASATEHLKKNKSLFISAEMGTGKTDMSVKISQSRIFKSNVFFIVCPTHLVTSWQEEIKLNFSNKNNYEIIVINKSQELIPYKNKDFSKENKIIYFILTKDKFKLSYPRKEVYQKKKKMFFDKDKKSIIEDIKLCPECGTQLESIYSSKNGFKVPKKCKCGNILREPDRNCSDNMRYRESISDYIFKNYPKGSYNLIIDEVHEYKGSDTGAGNSIGRLIANAKKIIALTGTIMNGYASSLFFILYRVNPPLLKSMGFLYSDVKKFVEQYGSFQKIETSQEEEGVYTRIKGSKTIVKEIPKVSPKLLSLLLNTTIFLKLEEIKMPTSLPPYKEQIIYSKLPEDDMSEAYFQYIGLVANKARRNKRFLGNLANDSIALLDDLFEERNAQEEIHYFPKQTKEEYGMTEKEKDLISKISDELQENRKVMVYITYSNQIGENMNKLLTEAFPNQRVKFLSPKISSSKRAEWIRNNPCDIFITNPELVKTGFTLLQFPTIIFYQTSYNLFTIKQSSRRSWRIGQKHDVRVFYMAYKDTPQSKALTLIGSKMMSSNALEGKFSQDEDLSSLGGESIQTEMAKAILNNNIVDKDDEKIEFSTSSNTNEEFSLCNNRELDEFEKYTEKYINNYVEEPITVETVEVEELTTVETVEVEELTTVETVEVEELTTDNLFDLLSNTTKKSTKKPTKKLKGKQLLLF